MRPTTGGLWVAQLGSAIIKQTIQDGRRRKNSFNVDRVHCRYFVQTSELGTYPHAMAWWSERGAALRIMSEAGAQERASSSSGVHFSFEKRDRVTCSTVIGRIDTLLEQQYYRHELISFAIDSEALELGRQHISEVINSEDEDEEQEAADAAAAAHERNALAQAAARDKETASHARYEVMAVRREEGKRRLEEAKASSSKHNRHV